MSAQHFIQQSLQKTELTSF